MTQAAIRVENLSKLFYIGHQKSGTQSARQVLANLLVRPFRRTLQLLTGHAGAASDLDEPLWALKDVSFEVGQGEVLGIIGRNGAGKSTLLKILSRITEPTSGRAVVHGRMGSLLEVGTGFHPDLSGRENVYLNGTMLGMSRAEVARKFDEIVAFAEIARFIDTPVKHYSSGMYTRLAFAVAAHLEPEILVVDEVLAVGDADFQRKCLGKMQDVSRSGRTVLFVSHSMGAVERLCTRTMVMQGGVVLFHGSTREAIGRYLAAGGGGSIDWRRAEPYPDHPHVRYAGLIGADGSPCSAPTSAQRLGIEIDIALPALRPDLILGMSVYNGMGGPLFSTSPLDCNVGWPGRPGVYRTRVLFPDAIFMPRQYLVSLALYEGAQVYDYVPTALNFHVAEVASLANQVHGGRIGDLQLLCEWSPFGPANSNGQGGA